MIEERARQISGVFDAALDSGEISLDDLFDHDYQPILGTDPEQVMTRFTEFTDCVLTPIHEEIVETCDSIIYSACVDKNGYLQRTTGNSPSHRATIQSGIPRIAAIGGSSMIGRACALRGKRSRCCCKHTGVIWAAANS